jgi:hypothetical protein
MIKLRWTLPLLLGALAQPGLAQTPNMVTPAQATAMNAAQAAACAAPEFRQFDFWVGRWDVYGPRGRLVAHSLIEKLYNACAIRENWMPNGLTGGGSLNAWDPNDHKWHQSWIDGQGTGFTYYTGGLVGKEMVLIAQGPTQNGQPGLLRMTFTPGADGSVRQVGNESTDNGKTWSALTFDFTYRPAAPAKE